MRLHSPRLVLGLLCGAAAALDLGAVARATTFVSMRTPALVAASIGAVRGRVTAIDSAVDPSSGWIYTYVSIAPSARLFGAFPAGTVVLRELGGRAGGREQWVVGSPEYRVGESVLVFLSRHADGALRTTALSMGKFSLEKRGGVTRAVRHFGAGTAMLDRRTGALEQPAPDDVMPLSDLLAAVHGSVVAGIGASPVHVLNRPSEMQQLALQPRPAFILFNPAVRWFEADAGIPIGYMVDSTGDLTLGPAASRGAVDAAMAVWTGVANASIELQDAGDAMPAPLGGCPDENRIVFNDPFEDIDAPQDCQGALAVTLVCDGDETDMVNSTTFRRILAAKITFNDGFGSCPFWTACNLGEIATHELGHSVGLAHSNFASATMAEKAHFDGRCAGITADDANALAFVYPLSPTLTPTPTVTPTSASTATMTRTGTITRTPTRTLTPSRTRTSSATATPSRTRIMSRTPSGTVTATASATPTASATASITRTATASRTPSPSPSPSRTASSTATAAPTFTPTPPRRPADWLASLVQALQRLIALLSSAGFPA